MKRKATVLNSRCDPAKFRKLDWDRKCVLRKRGQAETGKTSWAIHQFKNTLKRDDLDELKDLPLNCDGIIFDVLEHVRVVSVHTEAFWMDTRGVSTCHETTPHHDHDHNDTQRQPTKQQHQPTKQQHQPTKQPTNTHTQQKHSNTHSNITATTQRKRREKRSREMNRDRDEER